MMYILCGFNCSDFWSLAWIWLINFPSLLYTAEGDEQEDPDEEKEYSSGEEEMEYEDGEEEEMEYEEEEEEEEEDGEYNVEYIEVSVVHDLAWSRLWGW